jgi:hypothetical protein
MVDNSFDRQSEVTRQNSRPFSTGHPNSQHLVPTRSGNLALFTPQIDQCLCKEEPGLR